jgi:DNA-binding CsgD family transcriptional regulator
VLAGPLTAVEIRVLQKVPQLLSDADIAQETDLSFNTVETHLRHACMKAWASSRSATSSEPPGVVGFR